MEEILELKFRFGNFCFVKISIKTRLLDNSQVDFLVNG